MKLRNKKTGKVVEWFNNTDGILPNTLARLCQEWEDMPEEPKEYWFIDYDGGIIPFDRQKETATDKMMKSIGNYFETKEEAERAVEKIKAWKRLKDKGFKSYSSSICGDDFIAHFKLTNHVDYSQSIDDFDCVFDFGGKG